MKQHRERRIGDDVHAEIVAKGRLGWQPAEIERHLEADPRFSDRTPHRRTIRRVIHQDVAPRAAGDTWRLVDATPDEAAIILDALPALIEASRGRIGMPTRDEARLLVTIKSARPDIEVATAWTVIQTILAAQERGETAEREVWYLAFQPWQNSEQKARYEAAKDAGYIDGLRMAVGADASSTWQVQSRNRKG